MLRLLPVAAAFLALAIAGTFTLSAGGQSATESPTPTPEDSQTATPAPEATLPVENLPEYFPSPTPLPSWSPPPGYTGSLKPGDWIKISGTDSCLNVRIVPSLSVQNQDGTTTDTPLLNCLNDGFIGQLSFSAGNVWNPDQPMPVQADGYWWWYLLGQGYVAEDWLTFLQDEGTPFPARPELAGTGLIAFARPDGVWLTAADGTSTWILYPLDVSKSSWIGSIRWSPDGQLLAITRGLPDAPWVVSEIVDLDGVVVASYEGLSNPKWSPDGSALSATRNNEWTTVPVVVDRATGAETVLEGTSYEAPEWSLDGSAVAYMCNSANWQEYLPNGTTVDHSIQCNGDGLRVTSLTDGTTRVILPADPDAGLVALNPSWSPVADVIAVYTSSTDCNGYALYSASSGARLNCFALPTFAQLGGSCGGNAESGASDWSSDGATLAYHWQFSTGQNGVALVDVATGQRRMVQTTGASSISFSGNGEHIAFEASGFIWTADSDASDLTRLIDGQSPAWQPIP